MTMVIIDDNDDDFDGDEYGDFCDYDNNHCDNENNQYNNDNSDHDVSHYNANDDILLAY